MRYRKKVYGKTMCEVTDYHTGRTYKKQSARQKKEKITPLQMALQNQKNAEAQLRMLIDINFHEEDFYITLTYEKEPTLEQAKKDITLFIKKLRRRYVKLGQPLKYIYTCEGERRIHFHILVNRIQDMTVKELKGLWPHGYSKKEAYQGEWRDAVRIASYFVKESDRKLEATGFKRKWVSSQNLEKPKVKKERLQANTWAEVITPPKGYYVETDSIVEGVSLAGYPYRFYRLIKIEEPKSNQRWWKTKELNTPRNRVHVKRCST